MIFQYFNFINFLINMLQVVRQLGINRVRIGELKMILFLNGLNFF